MIQIFHSSRDDVIRSSFSSGITTYSYSIDSLYPLLDRFGEQRKAQSKKFYERLRADIVTGCVMPPITLAFIDTALSNSMDRALIEPYVNANIEAGYILDGMQRLISLKDCSDNPDFNAARPLYVNVIIAERYDLLLYRMITLNNGQKPMTARHQIEMLTKGALDLSGINLPISSEKQTEGTKISGAFRMSDVSEAYTAYLSNSPHNQNSKIIESKLDEILVGKVMDSRVSEETFTFSDILAEIGRLQELNENKEWLRQLNNLIGFTLGAKKSLLFIREMNLEEFRLSILLFEKAFEAINPSKVNVGKYRRELSALFISELEEYRNFETEQLENVFFQQTLSE